MKLLLLTLVLASHSDLDIAADLYERGSLAVAVVRVEMYEAANGPSPRSASMKALALHELGRDLEAHRALKVYLKLTEDLSLSSNPAHKDLVDLERELRQKLTTDKNHAVAEEVDRGAEEEARAASAAERVASEEAEKRTKELEARLETARHDTLIREAVEARKAHDQR